ncbi:hypothetical protein CBM2615_B40004 [Cupriavidus taiwanensis]|nr:hypothetical protein CBM2614_B40004 [Cupriavidus taiwanensis]SOZ69128.1 hypothetical protein CBM2615_B40004 [Cupriavidus taiwanensis]
MRSDARLRAIRARLENLSCAQSNCV